MTGNERMTRALEFLPPDKIALEYHPSICGLFEHGEAFRALVKSMPGDCEDFSDLPIPVPAGTFRADGSYYECSTDMWGTTWEYRIFGIMGHPKCWPLENLDAVYNYRPPAATAESPEAIQRLRSAAGRTHSAGGFFKAGNGGFFERMCSLARFEDVLMEISDDTARINHLADMLVNYNISEIETAISAGADAVSFGDDFGTQAGMLLSPDLWRHFFYPRYEKMIAIVKRAGRKALFHSCGQIAPILDDFARLGFDSIWPQQSLYDPYELAAHCKELKLAMCIHIDRANVMTLGSPGDVRRAVETAIDAYKPQNGGSWLYVEIDNGFPFENIKALFETIEKYRRPDR